MSADSLRSMALLETGFVEILKQFFTAKFDKVETFSCTARLKNDDEFDGRDNGKVTLASESH